MNIIIHKEHVQEDGHSQTQRLTQTQRSEEAVIGRCLLELCTTTRFTHSGHIIRFMLQCKLAPRLSGPIIPAPSLKSAEAGDGNWRIYVLWRDFLAHWPPSLSHADSSVGYAAVSNPINLKVTSVYNLYPFPLSALFFFFLPFSPGELAVLELSLWTHHECCNEVSNETNWREWIDYKWKNSDLTNTPEATYSFLFFLAMSFSPFNFKLKLRFGSIL